jgi:hypothetical protein
MDSHQIRIDIRFFNMQRMRVIINKLKKVAMTYQKNIVNQTGFEMTHG